ncbi:MAG: hypothetical protein ACRD28_00465 [Acidobacteriaceae bacterium]
MLLRQRGITRLSIAISTTAPGMIVSAFRNRREFPPMIQPIALDLTASPIHPPVIAKPMAVLLIPRETFPTTASACAEAIAPFVSG